MPSAKSLAVIHRVLHVGQIERDSFAAKREQTGLKVADALEVAITTELPLIIKGLTDLGFRPADRKARPARLPLNAALLQKLAAGSHAVNQDQTALLLCCLRAWSSGAKQSKAKAKPAKRTTKRGAK